MATTLLLLSVLAVSTSFISGQLDIPSRELGFVYNNADASAPIKLSAYIDVTCPDSKAAYPTLLEVADHFGPSQVLLRFYLFSLAYHRNSHTISKGAHVLNAFKSPKNATVFDWFHAIYANIDSLSTSATTDKSDVEVLEFLKNIASSVSGISPEVFAAGVANEDIDIHTRLEWKYGCTRGVYGTPLFTVNDVFVQADATWPVSEWVNLIKKLLGNGKRLRTC